MSINLLFDMITILTVSASKDGVVCLSYSDKSKHQGMSKENLIAR